MSRQLVMQMHYDVPRESRRCDVCEWGYAWHQGALCYHSQACPQIEGEGAEVEDVSRAETCPWWRPDFYGRLGICAAGAGMTLEPECSK